MRLLLVLSLLMQLSAAVRAALQKKEDSDQTGAQLVPAANISDDPVRSEFSAAVRAALQKKEDSDQTGAQLVPAANISDDPVRSDFLRSLQHSTVAAASSSDRGVEQSRRKVCFGFAALRNAVGGAWLGRALAAALKQFSCSMWHEDSVAPSPGNSVGMDRNLKPQLGSPDQTTTMLVGGHWF